jgi:hypothetical protein
MRSYIHILGVSRNVFAVCAFLMYKYNWGFEKSYDFVLSKKGDIQINQGFVQQLFALEKRLFSRRQKLLRIDSHSEGDNDVLTMEKLRKKDWNPVYIGGGGGGATSVKNSKNRDLSRDRNGKR